MTSVPTGTARPTPVADEMMPEGEEQPDENGADENHRGERGASVEVEVGDSDSDGDVEFVTPTNSPIRVGNKGLLTSVKKTAEQIASQKAKKKTKVRPPESKESGK